MFGEVWESTNKYFSNNGLAINDDKTVLMCRAQWQHTLCFSILYITNTIVR